MLELSLEYVSNFRVGMELRRMELVNYMQVPGALQSGSQTLSSGLELLLVFYTDIGYRCSYLGSRCICLYFRCVNFVRCSVTVKLSGAVNSAAGQFVTGADAMKPLCHWCGSLSTALSQITATSLSKETVVNMSTNLTDLNTTIQNLNTAVESNIIT